MILPVDDCRDDIADVHPGQTMYFTTAACAPGYVACNYTQVAGATYTPFFVCVTPGTCPAVTCSGGCPTAAPGAPTWDYDCSGVATPEPSTAMVCSNGPAHATACVGSGVNYTGTPACGSAVTGFMCSGMLAPFGSPCPAPTTSSALLGCR
jgi:hypothetical protein